MDTNILTYRIIVKKDGKSYHAFVPSLSGCHSQGKTIEEATKNIREAITGYLKVSQHEDQLINKDDGLESLETFDLNKIFTKNQSFSYA
jgi:predicted RNase H-like HicB family nuclease